MIHSNIFKRAVAAMMLVTAFVTVSTAQDAFYIYQNDGKVEGFFFDRVQKMEYSKTDTAGVTHEVMVAQIVVTDDSTYCFMLADIDSVSFVQPQIEYASGVRNMRTTGMIDYLISSDRDALTLTFRDDMPQSLQPRKNDILLDFDLQAGFGGKVNSVNTVDGTIVAQCMPLTDLHDIFEQFVAVEETGYDKKGNLVSRRVAGAPELTIDPAESLGLDSLATDTLMTSNARRFEDDFELPLFNMEFSGTRPFGDEEGLAEVEAKVKLASKLKGNYNIPRLRKPHYIAIAFISDFSVWLGLTANGKLEFSKESISDKVPEGVPIPTAVPLFELKCLPRLFFDAALEANAQFSIRGYKKRIWYKLEFINSWEPKFTKGSTDDIPGIKPDDEDEQEGPVAANLEFNGSIHFGMKFPYELRTNWVLRSFIDMSVGTEIKVGPKLSASLKVSFDEMFSNGANAYNALKDTKLSGEIINASIEASYKPAKGEKKTLFEGSVTPWKEVDLLYLLPAFKEWTTDRSYDGRLYGKEYALHLMCKDRPTLFSYPVGMGLYEPDDEGKFVRVGESWFNTYPRVFGSNRWTQSKVTTDHPTLKIGEYSVEMGEEPNKKTFNDGIYKIRPLYQFAGHTLEASPEYDLELGTYVKFMPRNAHLSNEYGSTTTVPIVTNAKNFSLLNNIDGSMFSYSHNDKQLTVKLEGSPNYHFFDPQTHVRELFFNVTTQDDRSQSRSALLNIIQDPNRTRLPISLYTSHMGEVPITPENIKFLGDKFFGNERMEIDVECYTSTVSLSYKQHCIVHMVITPGDTHETYNFSLDCSFHFVDAGAAPTRVKKAKYFSYYEGDYSLTGVLETEVGYFTDSRLGMRLNLNEVKSANGILYLYSAPEMALQKTYEVTPETITGMYITMPDMTKPEGQ